MNVPIYVFIIKIILIYLNNCDVWANNVIWRSSPIGKKVANHRPGSFGFLISRRMLRTLNVFPLTKRFFSIACLYPYTFMDNPKRNDVYDLWLLRKIYHVRFFFLFSYRYYVSSNIIIMEIWNLLGKPSRQEV